MKTDTLPAHAAKTWMIPVLISVAIMLTVYVTAMHDRRESEATLFFSAALRDALIRETVVVRGVPFEVTYGTALRVDGRRAGNQERFEALATTYALALARRDPFLGIAGTDPARLRAATEGLEHALQSLKEGSDESDAEAAFAALYPIRFLHELATIEEKRQVFLRSRTDTDAMEYQRALHKGALMYRNDAHRFAAFFRAIARPDVRISTVGGIVSTEGNLKVLDEMLVRTVQVHTAVRMRSNCLMGNVSHCPPTSVLLPIAASREQTTPIPPSVLEMESVEVRAQGERGYASDSIVSIASSTCLAEFPGPYYFGADIDESGGIRRFRYLGDIFLVSTDQPNAPTLSYMKNTLDMSYTPLSPIAFYVCPDVLRDVGTFAATIAAVRFAEKHPDSARTEQAAVVRAPGEHAAQRYVEAALREARPEDADVRRELEELRLMFKLRRGGLDSVINKMTDVLSHDAQLKKAGVPFDLSLQTLFTTHSAFPSLFMAYSTDWPDGTKVHTHDAEAFAQLRQNVFTFAQLRKSIPETKLLEDMRKYYFMDTIIP